MNYCLGRGKDKSRLFYSWCDAGLLEAVESPVFGRSVFSGPRIFIDPTQVGRTYWARKGDLLGFDYGPVVELSKEQSDQPEYDQWRNYRIDIGRGQVCIPAQPSSADIQHVGPLINTALK